MPRKSKDELKNESITITKNTKVETDTKKTTKKETTSKTTTARKGTTTTTKKTKTTKEPKVETKKSTSKSATTTKKTTRTRTASTKTSTKATSSRTRKPKTTSTSVAKTSSVKPVIANSEYYDLPYRYNQTTVKILAQTPTMLFVYWDISDDDRNSYIQKYGESFFDETKPVLVITNKTMNYTFEVEINDFANSWYLHLNDPDCDYSVELGRRPKYADSNNNNSNNDNTSSSGNYDTLDDYIYICTSNDMEMPNNHILFDKLGKSVFFKNTKTNFVEEKPISSLSFMTNIGKVYNVHDLYSVLYKDDINIEDLSSENIKLNLSSSNSPTSSFFK